MILLKFMDDKTQQLDEKGIETLLALICSKSRSEAAKHLGIDRSTLYNRIEKYQLDALVKKLPEEALGALKMASVKAANVLIQNLNNRDSKLQLESAKQILDRVGVTAKTDVSLQVDAIPDIGIEFVCDDETKKRNNF